MDKKQGIDELCKTCEHDSDSSQEYCGGCDGGAFSQWKEAGWVKDEKIARLKAEISDFGKTAQIQLIQKDREKLQVEVERLKEENEHWHQGGFISWDKHEEIVERLDKLIDTYRNDAQAFNRIKGITVEEIGKILQSVLFIDTSNENANEWLRLTQKEVTPLAQAIHARIQEVVNEKEINDSV